MLSLLMSPAAAQSQARIAGLENNREYMSLLKKEKALQMREDSLENIIGMTRKLFATESANKETYGNQIIRLEKELFETRNQIGLTVNSINSIEQEFVTSNLNRSNAGTPGNAGNTGSPENKKGGLEEYLKKNIPATDYALLTDARKHEMLVRSLISQYLENYGKMKEYLGIYETAPENEANQAYELLETTTALNKIIEDSIASVWSKVFDNKVYIYNLTLDKMGREQELKDFQNKYTATSQTIARTRDQMQSGVVFGYPLQNKFMLEYELALAKILEDKRVFDSISSKMTAADRNTYDIPALKVEPRNFIAYDSLKVVSPPAYNSANPIPEIRIYDYGTVYRIEVGRFAAKQPISLFKGAQPVFWQKEDGRYVYYIGAFKDIREASEGIDALKKLGFRRTELAVWCNGVFEHIGSVGADQITQFYRVEITGLGQNIDSEVKNRIEKAAPEKEISRIVEENGDFIYIVGSFDSLSEAEAAANAIKAVSDGVETKVITMEN